ncbi:hypothetical protein AVEN_88516-1 [Araneus ventricosus]|uniref:Uncharacterized protein n=1 Tax=Araneus ventricosus TaxID=182803 RepID=A0A4Y2E5Z0_ARAVE|nr:hypothetical protein AVEN_88516-1 [Araneus ventricosus]
MLRRRVNPVLLLSNRIYIHTNRQKDRLPVEGFRLIFERNLQFLHKEHIPYFILLAHSVFELSRLQAAVAVFRTGARLVSGDSEGPQNVFDVHRTAKMAANLCHWTQFYACVFIFSKFATERQADIIAAIFFRSEMWKFIKI